MSSWKNLFFLAILAVVGCGLYFSLMHAPGPPPPGAENASTEEPKVDPGQAMTGPPSTGGQNVGPPPGAEVAPSSVAPSPVVTTIPTPAPSPVSPVSPAPGVGYSEPVPPPPGTSPPGSVPPPPPDANIAPPPATTTMAPGGPPPAPPAAVVDRTAEARENVKKLLAVVNAELDHGRTADAHRMLSSLYGSPEVPSDMTREINGRLDEMAGVVIYSRQHLLERPYLVQPGDTLERIADTYSVPATLLARINGIRDPQGLKPGRELKVVHGPFAAVVSLEKLELTLMLQDRYAGRFAIGLGTDHRPIERTYTVCEKVLNPGYGGYGGGSFAVQPGDPKNPLGKFWIGLGDQIGIHGTTNPAGIGRTDNPGSICLSDRDIDDVYGILSVGSKVIIQR
ncbi:MAG: LysM peptidoglycan-binding domain-containing protein [Thermoguttaceae bacterium]